MWRQLQQALVVAFLVKIKHALSLHVVPEGTKANKVDNENLGTKKVMKTTVSGRRDDDYQWILAEPGVSCANTCPNGTGPEPGCNEDLIKFIDTEQEVINIGLSTGHFCNTSLGFGNADFPQIDVTFGYCSYRRGWSYEPTCSHGTVPATHRFCACGNEWFKSALGASCDATCAGIAPCNETALEKINTHEEIVALGASLGSPCDETEKIWAKEFPSQLPDGRCAYTYGYDVTCEMSAVSGSESRFCPCLNPGGSGDPHLTNLHGQKFDIVRAGISTFLLFPRSVDKIHQNTQLRVDASVEHPGDGTRCKGWYILRIWISGSKVGEEIEISTKGYEANDGLEIKIGRKVLRNETDFAEFVAKTKHSMTFIDRRSSLKAHHLNNRIKFARLQIHLEGVQLQITWSTGQQLPNAMNFGAARLKMIGTDWGGLLGGADHTWVSQYDPECRKHKNYRRLPQFFGDGEYPWKATASLD